MPHYCNKSCFKTGFSRRSWEASTIYNGLGQNALNSVLLLRYLNSYGNVKKPFLAIVYEKSAIIFYTGFSLAGSFFTFGPLLNNKYSVAHFLPFTPPEIPSSISPGTLPRNIGVPCMRLSSTGVHVH